MPRMEEMNRPLTRSDFEHRFHKLHAMLMQKKIHGLAAMKDSFLNLRLLPNKRLDLLSIDESARLQANTMSRSERFKDFFPPGAGATELTDSDKPSEPAAS